MYCNHCIDREAVTTKPYNGKIYSVCQRCADAWSPDELPEVPDLIMGRYKPRPPTSDERARARAIASGTAYMWRDGRKTLLSQL